jgi:hypothetical protein
MITCKRTSQASAGRGVGTKVTRGRVVEGQLPVLPDGEDYYRTRGVIETGDVQQPPGR